jgi:hypothetical protein
MALDYSKTFENLYLSIGYQFSDLIDSQFMALPARSVRHLRANRIGPSAVLLLCG